jgi:hypothetical protein
MSLIFALLLALAMGIAWDDIPLAILTGLVVSILWLVWHAAHEPDDEPDGY